MQDATKPFPDRRFHRRQFPRRQEQAIKQRAQNKEYRASRTDQTEVILQQPASQQGADNRPGTVLHHENREEAAAVLRANQLYHQRGAGRIEQRAPDTGEETGEPEQPRLLSDRHRGKACRAQQHTGDDHRFRAKAVGDGPAKDAQALLDKLA